jgi:phage-related protein
LSIAGQLLTSLSEALPDLMTSLAESFSVIVTDLFSEENITGFVQLLLDFIKNALAGIGEALPIILEAIKNVALNLIDALPEIFSMILGTIPDLIDNISLIIKNGLPVLVQGAIELISSICQNLPLILEQLFENLPRILESISSALTDNLPILIQCGIDLAKGLVVNLPKITLGLLKAAPGILLSIAKALLSGLSSIVEVGKSIVKGLWEGITGAASWLWDKITGWLRSIWDGIKNFFGIHSPSTKMRDMIGKNLVKGLAEGIVDEGKTAVNAMTALSKDLSAVTFSPITFKGITDDLSGAIPSDFDSQMRASVLTASQNSGGKAARSASPTFNTNVTFGNVTINDGSDVEDIAHRVSDIITNDVMVKGGAFA